VQRSGIADYFEVTKVSFASDRKRPRKTPAKAEGKAGESKTDITLAANICYVDNITVDSSSDEEKTVPVKRPRKTLAKADITLAEKDG
jgi:hypothetical protein